MHITNSQNDRTESQMDHCDNPMQEEQGNQEAIVYHKNELSREDLAKIYGRIKIVSSFGDYKVKVVTCFEDLSVKKVNHKASKPGEWQIVDTLPDFKIQLVNSAPDFKIKYVHSFPGVSRFKK